jgi:uncharacterized protein (UPF0335 family)
MNDDAHDDARLIGALANQVLRLEQEKAELQQALKDALAMTKGPMINPFDKPKAYHD